MVQQQHGLALQGGIISSADCAACTGGHRGCRAGGGGDTNAGGGSGGATTGASTAPHHHRPPWLLQPGGAQGDCNFGRACGGAHARDKGDCAWRGVHSKMFIWGTWLKS